MKQKIHRRRKVSIRVSLRGMLRLFRFDTLRRVHNVGFLVERLICDVFVKCILLGYSYHVGFVFTKERYDHTHTQYKSGTVVL